MDRSVKESLFDQVIKCSLQFPTAKDSEIFKASAESTKNVSETRLSGVAYMSVIQDSLLCSKDDSSVTIMPIYTFDFCCCKILV